MSDDLPRTVYFLLFGLLFPLIFWSLLLLFVPLCLIHFVATETTTLVHDGVRRPVTHDASAQHNRHLQTLLVVIAFFVGGQYMLYDANLTAAKVVCALVIIGASYQLCRDAFRARWHLPTLIVAVLLDFGYGVATSGRVHSLPCAVILITLCLFLIRSLMRQSLVWLRVPTIIMVASTLGAFIFVIFGSAT
ncbi:MAG: hypothetical protein AAF715_16845 [Myxococcota bacterium]